MKALSNKVGSPIASRIGRWWQLFLKIRFDPPIVCSYFDGPDSRKTEKLIVSVRMREKLRKCQRGVEKQR